METAGTRPGVKEALMPEWRLPVLSGGAEAVGVIVRDESVVLRKFPAEKSRDGEIALGGPAPFPKGCDFFEFLWMVLLAFAEPFGLLLERC
jgi:hypothetical protein